MSDTVIVLLQDKAFLFCFLKSIHRVGFVTCCTDITSWRSQETLSQFPEMSTITDIEVNLSLWSSLGLSLTLWINSHFPFSHSRLVFTVVWSPKQPSKVSLPLPLSLSHIHMHTYTHPPTDTHTCTHTHIHVLVSSPKSDNSLLIASCWLVFFLHSPLWIKLRGSSQGAGKVGCWCGPVGRHHRYRGLCWATSRSEPCRRLSPAALESAHTAAVPTVV